MKRLLDVVVSALMLTVLSPVLLGVALVVRLRMGSPVLFRQLRPGLGGEPFELIKFRTMRDGGLSDADRLTSVGRLLRSTSLDELPEFYNVLRGDMSLVGPRPLLEDYLPLYSARQATRHDVRPGITGLAQVSGRNSLTWEDRLELDAQYVESRSFVGDLSILIRTVSSVVRREGISSEDHATMERFSGSSPEQGRQ